MLRNSAPSTGTEPSQGICEVRRRSLACRRPAIAKLWPSRSSIVVTASRLMSDGMVVPEIVTALAKSSSLTSGAIRRLLMPLERTVGGRAADRNWKFAASQELSGIPGQRHQIGFGQSANQSLCFEGGDQHID